MQPIVIAEFQQRPQPAADQFTAEKFQIAANRAFRTEEVVIVRRLQP